MRRGWSHDIEPEVDSLSFVDFSETPDDPDERRAWNVQAAIDVYRAAGIGYNDLTRDTIVREVLDERYRLDGEVGFWRFVEMGVNATGFDTYNSDSRFEVFPPHTAKVRV